MRVGVGRTRDQPYLYDEYAGMHRGMPRLIYQALGSPRARDRAFAFGHHDHQIDERDPQDGKHSFHDAIPFKTSSIIIPNAPARLTSYQWQTLSSAERD